MNTQVSIYIYIIYNNPGIYIDPSNLSSKIMYANFDSHTLEFDLQHVV